MGNLMKHCMNCFQHQLKLDLHSVDNHREYKKQTENYTCQYPKS